MQSYLQDFSLAKNSDETLTVTVLSDLTSDTLVGSTIEWQVFESVYGVPMPSPVLIFKSSASGGILIPGSPDMVFDILVNHLDTSALGVGYYYHEAVVIDQIGNRTPVMYGSMTLTLSLGS